MATSAGNIRGPDVSKWTVEGWTKALDSVRGSLRGSVLLIDPSLWDGLSAVMGMHTLVSNYHVASVNLLNASDASLGTAEPGSEKVRAAQRRLQAAFKSLPLSTAGIVPAVSALSAGTGTGFGSEGSTLSSSSNSTLPAAPLAPVMTPGRQVVFLVSGITAAWFDYFEVLFPWISAIVKRAPASAGRWTGVTVLSTLNSATHAVSHSSPESPWTSADVPLFYEKELGGLFGPSGEGLLKVTWGSMDVAPVVPLGSTAFITPSLSSAWPPSPSIWESARTAAREETPLDAEIDPVALLKALPPHVGEALQGAAAAVAGMLSGVGLDWESYAVGPAAEAVAGFLASLPGPSDKKNTAAVVFIDRTMDCVTPMLHSDSLLDRLIRLTPDGSTPPARTNLLVPPAAGSVPAWKLIPGPQARLTRSKSMEVWRDLVYASGRDALNAWGGRSVALAQGSGVTLAARALKVGPKITPNQLLYYSRALGGSRKLCTGPQGYSAAVLTSLAAAVTPPASKVWSGRQGLEKELLLHASNPATEPDMVARVFAKYLMSPARAELGAVLSTMLATASALGGERLWSNDGEDLLASALMHAVFDDARVLDAEAITWLGAGVAAAVVAARGQPEENARTARFAVEERVQSVLAQIRSIANCRGPGRSLIAPEREEGPVQGLLERLTQAVLAPPSSVQDGEVDGGIKHVPRKAEGGVGGVGGGGVGAFFGGLTAALMSSSTRPRVADHSMIVYYVLGGLSGSEVRQVTEAVNGQSLYPVTIIVGGSDIACPMTLANGVGSWGGRGGN